MKCRFLPCCSFEKTKHYLLVARRPLRFQTEQSSRLTIHVPLLFIPVWIFLVWSTLSLLHATPLYAKSTVAPVTIPNSQSDEIGDVTQPIDVIVLLDDSGSMATCWPWQPDRPPITPPCGWGSDNPPSDPDALRYSAARLLMQLADEADRIAVLRFDNQAEGVGAAGTLQPVGAGENRRRLTEALQPPDDYFRRGYTRIDLGLQSAIDLLQNARQPGRSQYVLLLTDGEPSQQLGAGDQRERINGEIETLRNAGVFVFPVVLCNPTAGCAGEFLRDRFAESGVREAKNAQDLVRIFSEIFASMKSDRSVLTGRSADGALEFTTRAQHGVRRITIVTPSGGLRGVQKSEGVVATQPSLTEPHIDVNVIEGEPLAEGGDWRIETSDFSGFAVIQTDSYPQLVNPPPSVASSPASVRYYPAGKPLLLLARSSGPGAGEPLLYNGKTPLPAFGGSDLKMLLLTDTPASIRLQVGNDETPLQLIRTFDLEARSDLPQLQVLSPSEKNSGLLNDGHARLQATFGGSTELQNVTGNVLVTDESKDAQGGGKLVYQAAMNCLERTCVEEGFAPGDGRSYKVTYLLQAQQDGLRFSDWAQVNLGLKPAVYVQGLEPAFDLAQMPADGWPLELSAGTTEAIGNLVATLTLRRLESDEEAIGTKLAFTADVPEEGSLNTAMLVEGLDTLRPGTYEGEISLAVNGPSGRPMDIDIRPFSTLIVSYFVPRPAARLDTDQLNFGEVLFDTSPNFRLGEEQMLPLRFEGRPFDFQITLAESSCPNLNIVAGTLQLQENARALLPLQLASRDPVQPGLCSGTLLLHGPTDDYDVYPSEIAWQMRVNNVEWSVISTALNLGTFQDAGTQIQATLLVRYDGKTPFVLQMEDVHAEGKNQDEEVLLSKTQLEMPPVEVAGPTTAAGIFEVPVTFIARQPIVFDPLRGTFYNGEIQIGVVGLQDEAQTIGLSFVSPGLAQRYLLPYLLPVYSMPLLICTGPLTFFLLLIGLARFRGRDIDEDDLEDAALVSTFSSQSGTLTEAPETSGGLSTDFSETTTASGNWSGGDWSNNGSGAWGAGDSSDPASYSGGYGDTASTSSGSSATGDEDPWKSSW